MVRTRAVGLLFLVTTAVLSAGRVQELIPTPSRLLITTIDATAIGDPISKYVYGMFIEHLGNLINHGLWSEMLDDRKFYYAVDSRDQPEPANSSAELNPLTERGRRWRPVGGSAFVVMDTVHPYVGKQAPRIKLDGITPHGIEQAGLSLRRSKAYVGRVILAATPGTKIAISLVWGAGESERQTIVLTSLRSSYAKFPLKFISPVDTDSGRLEIVGLGSGFFAVGGASLMPADNIHGFRPDTVMLLRQLNSGFYRLPGGNFISGHDWRNAVGDPDKRPPTWDYAWDAMQPNDVGIDELMFLCKLLAVDPYVTVNAGLGDDHSAAELVEYANGSTDTRLGALRARNGHPEPYRIKYWNVGNEPYAFWQIGHTALEYYVLKHNAFASSMRHADPSITILASGAMPDEMTVTGNTRRLAGKVQAEFGSEDDWTGGLLARCWGNFDGLTEHWYARSGKRYDLNAGQNDPLRYGTGDGYVPVNEPLIDWVRRPSNRVRLKAEAWEEYKKRFPAIENSKIFLAIDEWAYIDAPTSLKLALSYALVLQEMFRHTDFIKMSAFTFATSCLEYDATDAALNTNGLMFKLYREHFGILPLKVSGDSPQPAPQWPVGGDQPRVNAGSSTYPLDVSAALTGDHKFLTLAVVNPTRSVQSIRLNIQGAKLGGRPKLWQLTGPDAEAANRLRQKPEVETVEKPLAEVPDTLSSAPISIQIYEFPLR
jgi:alpha-N-arabinofuranosidase